MRQAARLCPSLLVAQQLLCSALFVCVFRPAAATGSACVLGCWQFGCSCRRAALCGLHTTVVLLVRLCCFSLCVGGGRARRLHTCMQCVPLACPGFGTGWIVPGSVSASSATAAVGTRQLALCGSRHVRIMPCACLPLSLCVCRQLPDSCCFSGMLQLGRWGQPPAVQVRGLHPRIDVGHVTPSSSKSMCVGSCCMTLWSCVQRLQLGCLPCRLTTLCCGCLVVWRVSGVLRWRGSPRLSSLPVWF